MGLSGKFHSGLKEAKDVMRLEPVSEGAAHASPRPEANERTAETRRTPALTAGHAGSARGAGEAGAAGDEHSGAVVAGTRESSRADRVA